MAAWYEPPSQPQRVTPRFYVGVAWALYLTAALGLLGTILWRLWTEVLAGLW